jgi:sugar/nucleoside kinase (ribokinase family)
MPKGTPETVCIGNYTNSMGAGDAACSVFLACYRAMSLCK